MSTPSINQPPDLWERDGSYRDVYIQGASTTDWEALVALSTNYGRRYWCDGEEQVMPPVSEALADREHTHLMSLYVGSVRLNCHFFIPEEIELDIDPRDITGPEDHYAVLRFLERIATATNKKLLVTAENCEDIVLLSFEPAKNVWSVHAPSTNGDA